MHKVTNHLNIVTRHDELLMSALGTLRESEGTSYVGSTDEELRSVVSHERGVTTTFLLGKDLMKSACFTLI